ncbi:hypothetical protein Tco_1164958 [Tanacetum coccineum]|uniref:Uncharacterized protein n=1 Tax=Tanacetum coccineum TaxID=301880 RepID=A0ABQ5AVI5_9ASTR
MNFSMIEKPDLSYLHVFGALYYPTNDGVDSCSGPGAPKLLTPGTISSGLVPNIPSSTPYVPPTNNDWEKLFQPMFDEYLNPPPCVDPQFSAVIALEPTISTVTPSSMIIDQNAPSIKTDIQERSKRIAKAKKIRARNGKDQSQKSSQVQRKERKEE